MDGPAIFRGLFFSLVCIESDDIWKFTCPLPEKMLSRSKTISLLLTSMPAGLYLVGRQHNSDPRTGAFIYYVVYSRAEPRAKYNPLGLGSGGGRVLAPGGFTSHRGPRKRARTSSESAFCWANTYAIQFIKYS